MRPPRTLRFATVGDYGGHAGGGGGGSGGVGSYSRGRVHTAASVGPVDGGSEVVHGSVNNDGGPGSPAGMARSEIKVGFRRAQQSAPTNARPAPPIATCPPFPT